jgi:hypothetical protein
VRGVLETQPVLDQAVLPRLPDQGIEDLLVPFDAQTLAEVSEQRVMRQGAVQTQVQEIPIGHVAPCLLDDLTVGKIVLVLQELELEQ